MPYQRGALGELPEPMREGHEFLGWWTREEGGLRAGAATPVPWEDWSLHARWSVNRYTLAFDTAGGSPIDPVEADYGAALAPPPDPTREGWAFAGWTPAFPATMPAGDATLTAGWTINQYTLSFDTDGGSAIEAITQDYGTPGAPSASSPRKAALRRFTSCGSRGRTPRS